MMLYLNYKIYIAISVHLKLDMTDNRFSEKKGADCC